MSPEDVERALNGDRQLLQRLVALALDGDAQLQRRLIVELLNPVIRVTVYYTLRGYALSRGRDPNQDLDDFVNEVLMHLLREARGRRSMRRWDPQRGSLETLVRRIARNHVVEAMRRSRNIYSEDPTRNEDLPMYRDNRDIERELAEHELLERLFDELEGDDLQFAELHFRRGLSIPEIAKIMNKSTGAISSRKTRVRQRLGELRAELDNEGGGR